jgi:hypothetical protein
MQVCVKIDGREIRGRAWTGRHEEADVGAMYVKENGRERLSDLIFAAMVSYASLHYYEYEADKYSLKLTKSQWPN